MPTRLHIAHLLSVALLAVGGVALRSAVLNWIVGPVLVVVVVHLLGGVGRRRADDPEPR